MSAIMAAGCNPQTPPTVSAPTVSTPAANEVKFSGTISSIDNQMPADGNLTVKVDDKFVTVGLGGLRPENDKTESGQIVGFDFNANLNNYIGKKAEVYGQVVPEAKDAVTIIGDTKYYFKVIN